MFDIFRQNMMYSLLYRWNMLQVMLLYLRGNVDWNYIDCKCYS